MHAWHRILFFPTAKNLLGLVIRLELWEECKKASPTLRDKWINLFFNLWREWKSPGKISFVVRTTRYHTTNYIPTVELAILTNQLHPCKPGTRLTNAWCSSNANPFFPFPPHSMQAKPKWSWLLMFYFPCRDGLLFKTVRTIYPTQFYPRR